MWSWKRHTWHPCGSIGADLRLWGCWCCAYVCVCVSHIDSGASVAILTTWRTGSEQRFSSLNKRFVQMFTCLLIGVAKTTTVNLWPFVLMQVTANSAMWIIYFLLNLSPSASIPIVCETTIHEKFQLLVSPISMKKVTGSNRKNLKNNFLVYHNF